MSSESSKNQIKALESKVKQLEDTLKLQTKNHQLARQKITNLNRLKDNFLSTASHELRTPMSIIRGYAALLLSGEFGPLNSQQNRVLSKIEENSEQLTCLINNTLNISRLEAGKMQLALNKVNLKTLITKIIINHQVLVSQKDQTLSFINHTQKEETTLETDPEKISIVLRNLIGNAHKFTPRGGTISVELVLTEQWQIKVSDTGIGIPLSKRETIFEKFHQVTHSLQKKHNGTGLGLSISKKIIEELNGKIWIEDNPDHPTGITFHITLPK